LGRYGVEQHPAVAPRYVGINLLTELDAPNEYHIDRHGLVHFLPATPLARWSENPFISLNATAINVDGTSHVSLRGFRIAHSKATGISAINVTGLVVSNCTVHGHGGFGIDLEGGTAAVIADSSVFDIGCTAIQAHCGEMYSMRSGGCVVSGNTVTQMGLQKRTYQPGIHWAGVGARSDQAMLPFATITDTPPLPGRSIFDAVHFDCDLPMSRLFLLRNIEDRNASPPTACRQQLYL
jgi:hypothetical protein